MMLVVQWSTIVYMHCISAMLSGMVFRGLGWLNPVFQCHINIDLTFSFRVAISACAANSFWLLSIEGSWRLIR